MQFNTTRSCELRGGCLFSLALDVSWGVGCLSIGQLAALLSLVLGSQKTVPEGEEWLGKVGLDSPGLVVDVMVGSVVVGNQLQWIPRELVAAMIIDGLERREAEEAHALADCHSHCLEGDASTKSIKEEPLERVVVQGSISVGNVQSVMTGVEGCCFVLVGRVTLLLASSTTYCTSTCSCA